MTPTGTTPQHRRIPRGVLAASAAGVLAAAGGVAWIGTGSGAGADPVSTDVAATCSLAGSNVDVTVPMTVDDLVDPVAPGGAETLHVDQALGQLPVEVTVDRVVITTPIPAQVASTDSVTFEGGNMAGSYAVDGTNLVVTFTGPQSSSQLQFPRVIVNQTISDSPTGETIEWKVWSQLVTDTNYGQAVCTPKDPNQNLNTTTIDGAGGSGGSGGSGAGGNGGGGSTSTTVTGGGRGGAGRSTTTAAGGTTATTAPPAADPGTASPGVSLCVKLTPPLPIPCPITLPPSGDGGLPIPALPIPDLPIPELPLPVPPSGGGGLPIPELPIPVPPTGGTGGGSVGIGVEIGVSS